MTPEDETPRDDETPPEGEAPGTPDGGGDEQEASPSTYAGRRRAESAESDEADGDHGLTEEFDRIERELDAELDELDADDLNDADEGGDGEDPDDDIESAWGGDEDDADDSEEPQDEDDTDDEDEAEDDQEGEDDEEGDEADEGEEAAAAPSKTIEAETVALADREQAEEAALAGLKARAGGGKWETSAEHEQLDVGASPAPEDDEEKTPRAKPIWARFLAASLLIVVSVASATAISILVYLTDIAEGLHDNKKFAKFADQFTQVDGGDPQTILIIGSDERQGVPNDKRSDTTILLRIDPDQQAISLLSIPRDLRVSIPNHGHDKFNAAYSYGGAGLTLRTVKQLTGLEIQHLVNINFTGFADAVDAIDCVYIDVDRRYFIPEEDEISEINLEAGYQRMCGYNALQYVRFRHLDNDLVRSARQQDFLREARAQVPPWKLIEDGEDLIQIFTDYTTSDIDNPITLLELLETLFDARNAELREVHFPAQLGEIYVDVDTKELQTAIDDFLGTEGTPGPPETGEANQSADEDDKKDGDKKDGDKKDSEPEGPVMENSTAQGEQYAHQVSIKKKKNGDPMVTFPIFYPTQLVPSSLITNDSRAFPIDGPGDEVYYGYKLSVEVEGAAFGNGVPYEYYGISGTNWKDPPILENPSETKEIDGRTYDLYYDGDRMRLIAWHDPRGNSYWINNTLSQSLTYSQMLAIATSMKHDD